MHSDNFHNKAGLDFHVRTTMHEGMYSYIDSAAVRVGEHVVEIQNGKVIVNKKEHKDDELPLSFGQYDLALLKQQVDKDGNVIRRSYILKLDETSAMEFKFYKEFMTFDLIGHHEFTDAAGLLGSYPRGDMISRSGEEMNRFEDFGFEWQVGPSDAKLFSDLRAPQLPYERCRIPEQQTAGAGRRKLRGQNAKLLSAAQKACASQNGNDFSLCVEDVMMTGDLEMAAEW